MRDGVRESVDGGEEGWVGLQLQNVSSLGEVEGARHFVFVVIGLKPIPLPLNLT